MKHLLTLVEGPGDVAAVPVLLTKLLKQAQRYDWAPAKPIIVKGLAPLRRRLSDFAELLRMKMAAGQCHGALVLLDLEDDCPRAEAWALAADLAAFRLPYPVAVVFAYREYEEWLVASLASITPHTPLIKDETRRDYTIEAKRGVKEWLTKQMPYGHIYRETTHQEAFTYHLDPTLALECRSFQRLVDALAEVLAGAQTPRPGMTTPQQ